MCCTTGEFKILFERENVWPWQGSRLTLRKLGCGTVAIFHLGSTCLATHTQKPRVKHDTVTMRKWQHSNRPIKLEPKFWKPSTYGNVGKHRNAGIRKGNLSSVPIPNVSNFRDCRMPAHGWKILEACSGPFFALSWPNRFHSVIPKFFSN